MPSSTLTELKEALAEEAQARGAIRLDGSFLAKRVLDLIGTGLPPLADAVELSAGAATLQLSGDGTTLFVQKATVPTEPKQVPLDLAGAGADVAIRQTSAGDPTGFDLILRLTLPPDWEFGDSLPELWGLQPPAALSTPNGQYLYFSSFATCRHLPEFPGEKAPDDKGKALREGLNYYADLAPGGVFEQLERFFKLPGLTVPLVGSVTPDAKQPELELRAEPQVPKLEIGFLELGMPFIGVKTVWIEDTELGPMPNVLFFVGADIEVETSTKKKKGVELQVVFLDQTATSFLLRLGALPGETLSLGSLAEALLDTEGNILEDAVGNDLKSKLESITLEDLSAQVAPRAETPVQYVNVRIGTAEPWEIGSGKEKYKLDLTFDWTSFFGEASGWTASFEAELVVREKEPKLSFDVIVAVPELSIQGSENGSVELTLSDLNEIFPLEVPEGLMTLKLADFNVAITAEPGHASKLTHYSLYGVASVSIAPFGTPILALENVEIALSIDTSKDPSQHTLNLEGTVVLGGALKLFASATISNVPETDTVFTLHLVEETVGSMLNHLAHLIDPTYDISFPSPWDRFLAISLDAFVLEVNLTKETVTISYDKEIDLEFLTVTKLSLAYKKANKKENKPSSTTVTVSGSFLGMQFGSGGNKPLSWDPVNENPPAVPGKTSMLDLRYAGLGQHVGFARQQPKTIPEVLKALTESVVPVQPGQLPQFGDKEGQLEFQAGSGWLIGADLTVMGTVSLAAIFNDPNLYGIRISLAGEKAGSFAGLSFEIVYRKVTETIGVYHVELQLPTAMRTLELGEVSLTLPLVVLDVYTNGNFRVDLGFPKGLDFSNSFCLQVFPFLGYGGFYFALLDGATSSRVPQITNGTFSPVLELGVGLRVGVGKTVNEGILSGGLSVTVTGIVEGALAWFHPTDSSPQETYYWMHGTIAVVGRLYATIDFAIIQASVDVTATLSASLTIESHQPIFIEASASVSVRVGIKVVFFTIHLTFSATIRVAFTIGQATPTPWKLAGGGNQATLAAAGRRTEYAAAALPVGHRATLRRQLLAADATPIVEWPAVLVLPELEKAGLWAIAAFTREDDGSGTEAVLLLAAENSIHPEAPSVAAHREVAGEEPEKKTFNLLIAAMLGWGVHVETNPAIAAGGAARAAGTARITTKRPHGLPAGARVTLAGVDDPSFDGEVEVAEVLSPTSFSCAQAGPDASSGNGSVSSDLVYADQLEDLRQALGLAQTVEAAFGFETLSRFLAANLELDVAAGGGATGPTGVTFFPFVPGMTLKAGGTEVKPEAASAAYQRNVRGYFQSLQARFETAPEAGGDPGQAAPAATPAADTMPAVVFSQYFNMLMSQAVKAAIDLLAALPFEVGATAMSVAQIGAAVGDGNLIAEPMRIVAPNQATERALNPGTAIRLPAVTHQIRAGETLAAIATQLNHLGAADLSGQPYTAARLLAENADPEEVPTADAIFSSGVAVAYEGIEYETQPEDSLELVATRLLVRIGGGALVNGLPRLAEAVEALLVENKKTIDSATEPIEPGSRVELPGGGIYVAVTGDTLILVAAYTVAVANHAISPTAVVEALKRLNGLEHMKASEKLPPGTRLKIPELTRSTEPGDSVASIAKTLISDRAPVEASLLRAPAEPQLLSPHGVLRTPTLYGVAQGDTLSGIAGKLDLALADLAGPAAAAQKLFAAGAKLKIEDVPAIAVDRLNQTLLAEGDWNTAAGAVSRFLLSGLRLPDPTDKSFEELTPEQLREPEVLAKIATRPLYELSGQQFPIAASPPAGYRIELGKPAGEAEWLRLGGGSSLPFELSREELALLAEIGKQGPNPQVQTLTRLALARMEPTRTALGRRIVWQAAAPPPGCAPGGGAGNPALWVFPEQLVRAIGAEPQRTRPLLYELAAQPKATPEVATELAAYRWATLVDLTISLPELPGDAPAAANAVVVEGADDTGAALLQQLHEAASRAKATSLYLLYEPDPAGPTPSGLASDALAPDSTWLLKTNLTTLTSSGVQVTDADGLAADPSDVYAARIEEPAEFLALLWEASITRSGGFFLDYVNADGGSGLPGSVFGGGSTARLSLLALLDSGEPGPGAIMPFHNCAVVGDNVDPASATVVAQPVTREVGEGESLAEAAQWFEGKWGRSLAAAGLASLNADVPQLLRLGAELSIPGQPSPYPVEYGDTFGSIARAHGVSVEALAGAGANATAPILATGAQLQFAPGVLSPSTTAPPGTAGFELVRVDPDPENLPHAELGTAQLVDSLFNLLSWRIGEGGGFLASGEGLPTTPTEAGPDWSYSQSLAAAPFAEVAHGSVSTALPPAAANPYNGIGVNNGPGELELKLALQDVYGNRQQLPSEWDSVTVRVGYFDEVVGLSAWPSLAVSYLVADGVELDLSLTMQQERYVPSPSVSVASALAAIEADLASYRGIHYQLAQPDLDFALQTTLSLDSEGKPRSYPLAKVPFLAFARGAYVQLAALATLEKVEADAGGIELTALAERYGVTPAQLLEANGSTLYSALFGATALQVPKTWTTIAGDTLAAIAKRFGLSVEKLARDNEDAPLDPGTSLTTPARTVEASAGARLADLAAAARASVPGLATANEAREGILTTGARLTLGTATYPVAPNDSLAKAAAALKAPVAAVAVANQFLPDLFVAGTQLQVTDVVAGDGDTLGRLAAGFDPSGVASLAEANEEVANLFAPATSLEVGIEGSVEGPLPSDTLLSFARANRLTVEQLAGANGAAAFAAGAKPTIPATLTQGEGPRWCTHRAGEDATLAKIGGLFGVQPADVVALNPDLPGLLAAGQTIRDSGSGSSVTTAAEDSFASIVARFRSEHGVTVTLPQLAADVATQAGLLLDSGLWICPPMRGDAYGANSKGTLKELAGAYGVEPATIAIANAATIGLFAEGVPLKLPGWPDPPITTGPYETFNSLVTRLAAKDVEMTVEEVAKAVDAVEGLIAKEAGVVAVPPPPPPCSTPVQPSFTEPVFQLRVEVVAERNRNLIDPEFTGAPAVAVAATTIAAHPDPGGSKTLSLTEFAEKLQEALPGLAVAAGDPAVEGEPTASSTVWCVDFGPGRTGLRYTLKPDAANYYALPPLSRELMAGRVEVAPYESGKGLGETKLPRNFQAIDLDAWLNRFFAAVDVFLSPASVVGAYVAAPKQVEAVIDAKRRLADRVSRRIETVLGEEPGPAAEKAAEERMLQALLQKLGNATSVSTLVQLPAGVESPYLKSKGATRLSGRLVPRTARPADETDAYSFSTAKLPMVDGESNATFLLSVKAPEESSQLSVEVEYSVSEIELPAPGARIDDYEGSSWLKLVLPAAPGTALPLDVPVPLRAYPSPVTLASQTATQTVEKPAKASDLLGWEMQFVYQHADAEQDAALVEVAFDPRVEAAGAGRADDLDLDAIFAALAQFAEVEGALSDDLAKLAPQPPGKANPITTKAVEAFATIATGVALAFESKAAPAAVEPTPETFCYRLVREQNKGGTLARLAITAVEPETGKPMPNPVHVWPGVWVTIGKEQVRLAQEGEPTEIEARYAYPAGIEASEPLEERFAFALGGGEPALPELPQTGATLAGPKLFAFEDVDVLSRQNGRAGVSIWRNWSLVGGKTTNPSFVYQTPTARFPGLATPTVTAGGAIELGAAPTPLAQALGEFFKQLTTSRDNWEPEDGLQLRIGCGYAYTVADSDEGDTDLTAVVPCFLVPSTEFHPAAATAPTPRPADWDWEQPASFVSQVAAMAEAWRKEQQPSTRGAAFSFDLTAYAGGGQLQPLIRAGGLRYELG